MKTFSRRSALKLASAASVSALAAASSALPLARHGDVALWETFEVAFDGPREGNPFVDVELTAVFRLDHREVKVWGFYDGDGVYKVRFMPDAVGAWSYTTESSAAALRGQQGRFVATAAKAGVRGMVGVQNIHHFAYGDGTPYYPFGTTCYAWAWASEALQQQTIETLKTAPFNKMRMCVFPTHGEPVLYPFERDSTGKNDFSRLNPAYFAHLERRVGELQAMGIEVDLILFHPYDHWGYAEMSAAEDDRYLKYVLARFSAFRSIWWSLANEFDLMKAKKVSDFDRLFHIVEQHDPYGHLRSIHYSKVMYDYTHLWVTHASLQTWKFEEAPGYLTAWNKPVVFDEVKYEGNLNRRWGNLTGEEMAYRVWQGVVAGCYVTHGEVLLDPDAPLEEGSSVLWGADGGVLRGTSAPKIGFLRKIVEESGAVADARPGFEADVDAYYLNARVMAKDGKRVRVVLYYFDYHQPAWYDFPLPEGQFTAELIDPAGQTIERWQGYSQARQSSNWPEGRIRRCVLSQQASA